MVYPSARRTLGLRFDFSGVKEKAVFSSESKTDNRSTQEKDLEKGCIYAMKSCMKEAERRDLSHETLPVEKH